MKSLWLQRFMLLGIGLALGGSILIWRNLRVAPQPAGELRTVTEYTEPRVLPAFRLPGTDGVLDNARLQGRWSFIFFGYTQCPDVCPAALALMRELKAAVPPAPSFQAIFVSVDPARDSLDLLRPYLASFDPAFIGATGEDAALAPLLKDLGVFYRRNDAQDRLHYTVDHSASIFLIDPAGRLAASFSPPQEMTRMAADFRRITMR